MSPSSTPSCGAGLVPAPRRADGVLMGADADFGVVYGRWMPELTRYCRRILKSDADAEDAAQNAMLKAMAALETGPAPRELAPWLHRIARNEAISLLRRRGAGTELLEELHPAGPDLEEVAGVRARLAELLGDVQALPERQREALVLRELDGLPYKAIASRLGVTEGAAQQAVLDARLSLQDCDAGRNLACDGVRGWMSSHEHARLRTRRVRAHLRDCDGCRGFQRALTTRPRELALLLPVVSGAGALGRVLALLGGGGSGAGAVKAVVAAGLVATAGVGLAERAFDGPPARERGNAPARRPAVTTAAPVATPTTPQARSVVVARTAAARITARAAARRSAAGGRSRSGGTSTRTDRRSKRGRVPSGGTPGAAAEPTREGAGASPEERGPATSSAAKPSRPTTTPSAAPGSTAPSNASAAPEAPAAVAPVTDAVAPAVSAATGAAQGAVDAAADAVDQVTEAIGVPKISPPVRDVTHGVLGP